MIKNLVLSLVAILALGVSAFAQNKQVTGMVSDEQGQPLIGASVSVENNPTVGTTTGGDGRFSLTVPAHASLEITYSGYNPQTVSVAGTSTVNVTLREGVELETLVITGYGTGKQIGSVIGVVDQVKGEKLENRPSNNVADALQGQVAGLQVMTNNGELNTASSMRIHGVGSISAGNAPLILLDGAPVSSATLMALNQNDIASVNVLKDASATSIYGSRASNGVIYVTTKTGRRDREESAQVTLRAQYALSSPTTPKITRMNTNQVLDYMGAIALARSNSPVSASDPAYATAVQQYRQQYILAFGLSGMEKNNINWWKEILNHKAPMYQIDLSVNGGSQKTNYYLSGNYSDQTGVAPGSQLNRYTFRTNVDTRVNNWLRMGMNMGLSYVEATSAQTMGTTGQLYVSNPIIASLITPSYQPLYDEKTGEMIKLFPTTKAINPILQPNWMPRSNNRLQIYGTAFTELNPIKGLNIRTQLSGDGYDYQSSSSNSPQTPSGAGGVFGLGSAAEAYQRSYTWTWTNTAEYKHSIKDLHNLTYLLGEETIFFNSDSRGISSSGITSSDFVNIMMGAEAALPSYGNSSWASNSLFGRVEYNYDERYSIEATLRNDASSRFAKKNRNALFYSGALMWNAKKESFLRDNQTITDLRIRGSYGTQGNSEIGYYNHLRYLAPGSDYGEGGTTWALSSYGNPNLTWENQSKLTLGFDMQLLKKLNIEFSWYRRQTDDMLMSIPKALSTGVGSIAGNIGGMRNSGIDLTVNYDIYATRDWYVNFRTTFNYNKNQITNLWDPSIQEQQMSELNAFAIGKPIYLWSMAEWRGVDPNTGKDTWTTAPDGTTGQRGVTSDWNAADKYVHRKTTRFAPFTGGFSLTGQWKGLALSTDFSWVAGNEIYNNTMYFLANPNQIYGGYSGATEALNYWTEVNRNSKYPKLTEQIHGDSRMLESGSFLRLKNIQLSYALPQHIMDRTRFIKGLKVWVGARNLWTVTGYKGLDPEVADSGSDVDVYPNSRQFTFGLELRF